MKKQLKPMLLLVTLALLLAACGSETVNKGVSSSYIGDWVYDNGEGLTITFHIKEGGMGSYELSSEEDVFWYFSYEIRDDVIVMTRNAIGTTFLAAYELSDDGSSLTYVSGDFPYGTYIKK